MSEKRNTGEELEVSWIELHSKAATRRYLQFAATDQTQPMSDLEKAL